MRIHHLAIPAVLAAGFAGSVLAAGLNMNGLDLGRVVDIGQKLATATSDVPEEREIEIGRGMAASLLGATPLVRDDGVQRYVNRIGMWIAAQTERANLPWHFGVLDTETVNAFAAPGGYVFVTRGLLRIAGSESDLAGVLSHEIGHVLRRHHLEAIRKQAMQGLAMDLVGEAVSRSAHFNAAPFIQAGMQVYARGLDRDDEFEADGIGVVLAARGGYEPYGLPRVLLAINQVRPGAADLALLNATHPPTMDRLARLESLMTGKFEIYEQHPAVAERYQQTVGPLRQ
jgi:predicted Zn-dependent protease